MARYVKSFNLWNNHYQGLSELWHVEVTYIGGGPRQHFEGTMEECNAFIQRTLVMTGQPYSDKQE